MNIIKIVPYILLLFILKASGLVAANRSASFGGRAGALGNASITLSDFWSFMNNQAGLANNKTLSAGVFAENRFLTESLSTKAAGIIFPIYSGSLGINFTQFGDHRYSESNIGVACGIKLHKDFMAGIQIDYFFLKLGYGYGQAEQLSFQGGFIFQPDEKLRMAAHVYNPKLQKQNRKSLQLPEIFRMGLDYKIAENILVIAEIRSHSVFGISLHSGIEYKFLKNFAVRAGYASMPDNLTFGIGLALKKVQIDISSSLHSVLGYSPQFSLIYAF